MKTNPAVTFDRAPIQAVARRRRLISRSAAAGLGLAALLLSVFVLAGLDARFAWAEPLRRGLLGTVITGAVAALIVRWRSGRQGEDARDVLREMEAQQPANGQQLRTAWEVAERGIPLKATPDEQHFSRSLLAKAQRQVLTSKWEKLAPAGRAVVWIVLCAALLAGMAGVAVKSPDFRLALRRVLVPANAPTFTTVAWQSVPDKFDDRHPPRLAVTLSGRAAAPLLEVQPLGSSAWEKRPLTVLEDGRTYDAVLTGLDRDFVARVTAGDGATPPQLLRYRPIPRLEEAKVAIQYPDYTGKAPEERQGGDAKAVEGSTLNWAFRFNTTPTRVEWKLAAGTNEPNIVPVQIQGSIVNATWQAPLGQFSGVLTVYDDEGATVDSWKYEVAGVADAMPKVELLEPVKDTEATSVTELPVRIRARDDFGVAEVGLIMEAAGETIWTLEKVIDAKDQRDISELTRAMLETVPLTLQDNIKLYAYALDHKPRGGPRSVSGLRAIDIRAFKKREIYLGKQEGPPVSPAEVMKLNKLIKGQREVVSATHILKEEARDEAAAGLGAKSQEIATKEDKVIEDTSVLIADWALEPSIPRDDLSLLNTAQAQMGEASRYLLRNFAERAHNSGDRALSSLIAIRKHLLKLIMESDKPCPCEEESDPMKKLQEFANEAERLAGEEKSVRGQINPERKEGIASLESTRRQQEVAVSDAGELFAGIVAHPQKNEGMETLMAAAEKAMREADEKLHSDEHLTAQSPLQEGEQNLRDLADFIRAMESSKLADTLDQMAAKAKNDAKKAGEKKESPSADKKDLAANAPKPGAGAPKPAGPPADKPGSQPGEGSASGQGDKSGQPQQETAANEPKPDPAAEAARNTQLANEILKALEKLAPAAAKPDEPGAEGDPKKPGLSAAEIASLRERLDAEALAKDLKEAAKGGNQPGEGPGEEGAPDQKALAARLEKMAKELTAESSRLKASQLARLAEVRAKAQALREKAEAAKAAEGSAQEKEIIKQLVAQGFPPGSQININGKVVTIPGPGAPSGDKPGEKPGQGLAGGKTPDGKPNSSAEETAGFGRALGRFVSEANRLNDEPIIGWTQQLDTVVPEVVIPALEGIVNRLDVMIAALPGGAVPQTAQTRVPEAHRREVEAYYRNLSDDFGHEQ